MPIPSPTWFPRSLQEQAAWELNFNTQCQATGTTYGLTTGECDQIKDDNNTVQFLADAAVTLDDYIDAVREYRNGVLEDPIDGTTPTFPADVNFTPPTAVPRGIFERIINAAKRIKASADYTVAVGELYGIAPSTPEAPVVGSEPPVIEADVEPGNEVVVKFVKGKSGGIYIESNADAGGWSLSGTPNKSPFTFTVPPNGGSPRNVQIRARFLDGNTPVGDWSNIVTVQTIP